MMFKFVDMHPVTGDMQSYILREGEFDYLYRNIFEVIDKDKGKVNYSITGINRIGKTSLIKELCRKFDEEKHPNTLVLFTSLEGVRNFWTYWRGKVILPLIKLIDMDEIKTIDDDYFEQIIEIKDYFEDDVVLQKLFAKDYDVVEHEAAKEKLEILLSLLGYCGKSVLLIIDEFDLSVKVFGENDDFFDWFRGLLQDESHPLSAVTISRRSIYYIETTAFGGSTLSGTFKPFWVFGYKNSELRSFFKILECNGYKLSDKEKRDVVYYCGRSPYYLAIMGNAILETNNSSSEIDIGRLFYNERRYYSSFSHVVDILKKEELYDTMLQLFVGPQYNLDREKISSLIGNGYCMEKYDLHTNSFGDEYHDMYGTYEEDYSYLTVCNSFIDYLALRKKHDVENIFPQLSKAENMLRLLVKNHMKKCYGEVWKEKLSSIVFNELLANDKMRSKTLHRDYDRYLNQRQNADDPNETDDSILNVISIYELGAIIRRGWDEFYKGIFPSYLSWKEFEKGIVLLNKVRNPVAHGNIKIVPHDEISRARGFSETIYSALKDNIN
ncbi:ATP-binding protein [Selenomonas sp. FC4001]|uniref:ATP-binding protein n=1 Tax=Selenomonas sp. FC4001 TaxID=1408313 RepID=UPI00055E567D|nr:ATP-binding protein [Selenomonas sp. FC4001]